ncbi:MAG TPA: FtsQ-type POTRA domain-containing protein [Anaerolineae bacterium]|nr:FtsQ-type POTRA domain-containing protein [Anaerolineae bacterium]
MRVRSQAKPQRHYRRYDSVDLGGTLKAQPRFRRRSINLKWIALGVIGVSVVGAILYLWLSDTFYVTRLSLTGNTLTPAQEIVQISEIGGQHILWVNHTAAAERIVNGIPSIKSARVDCQLPNRCVIKVEERQPRVAWRFGGAVTWIADDGLAFAAQADAGLPLVTIEAPQGPALQPGKEADQRIVKAALAVAQALPSVRQYKYTVERGLEFQSERGFPVYLGLGENMADRAMMWKAVEAELAQLDVTPRFMDLRYPVAPYFVSEQ